MPEVVSSFIKRLAAGDSIAAQQWEKEYFGQLVRFVRSKLGGFSRRDSDEEDVAVSAMRSFYSGLIQGEFHVHDRKELTTLLFTIAARKTAKRIRKECAQKRGGGEIRGESVFGDELGGLDRIMGKVPTPELIAEVAENCQLLLDMLPDQTFRDIVQWTLEGYSTKDIAEKLGCVRRTIERKLERIREIWATDVP